MLVRRLFSFACLGLAMNFVSPASAAEPKAPSGPAKIKLGILGCDTSHCTAFATAINDPKADGELAAVHVVAAFPGGSADIPASADRVAGFTAQLKAMDIEIVDSIEALLTKVDGVLLESVDGRPHLAQARAVIAARKPLFIDKPLAGSLADGLEIFRLAREAGVPCFSSSSLRFAPETQATRNDPKLGRILGATTFSPCSLEPHHPDLFWYGIHGVETLYTLMGPGCVSVTRVHTDDADEVTGLWKDGRIGTFRGLRGGKPGYGAVAFGEHGIAFTGKYEGYKPLLVEVARFFRTGQPPVSAEETLELLAFMEAADESRRQGGTPVTLERVMAKAKASTAARSAQ
jgi:GFO/IDH/MocA oxidoreductase family protein